ncbi:hypothetical protein HY498_04340 [Candidatus Woesearchaeota archaeon]|nr:hypothetical protein [Candidatus Woesearchaeota archaeon]
MGEKLFIVVLVVLIFGLIVFAQNNGEVLNGQFNDRTLFYLLIASIVSIIFICDAVYMRTYPVVFKREKKFLFLAIIIPIVLVTLYMAFSTIYLNIMAETRGPVHWHADFEIFACGKKIDLASPKGLVNRVGTSTFHEHGDNRIHIEGLVLNLRQITLKNFLKVTGGALDDNKIIVNTDEGLVEFENGDLCDNENGELQVFVYKTKDKKYYQQKIKDFENYVISSYSYVPPGDCLIIEFDIKKDKTDKICETYKTAIQKGDLDGS